MLNYPTLSTYSEIEFELNSILKSKWLSDIIEVTYWYTSPKDNSEISYNTTLFEDFLGISHDDFVNRWSSFPALKLAFLHKTELFVKRFNNIVRAIQDCEDVDDTKKELIVNAINYNITLIRLAENGIEFELEKAWMKLDLTDEEIKAKLEVNEWLEKLLFWWNILDSEEESIWCLKFIEKRFQLKWNNLTEDEKVKFSTYIEKLKSILQTKGYTYISPSEEEVNKKDNKDSFFEKYWDVKIPRNTYFHIFQEVIKLSWLKQNIALSVPSGKWSIQWFDQTMIKFVKLFYGDIDVRVTSKWSIYDWVDYLEFPFSYNSFLVLLDNNAHKLDWFEDLTIEDKNSLLNHLKDKENISKVKNINSVLIFDELPIERVMKLIAHEILGHYYNQRNHEKYFWNIRWVWNVEKEEGLAKFMEYTLLGRSIIDDDIYEAPFSQLFACEVLTWDEFKEFLFIFTKIAEAKSTNKALLMRRKRNYSMNYSWAQHKDTTYTRWLKRISDYVKSGWDIKLLFNGKFWLDDIFAKKIDFSSNEDFLLPIFVPDIIIFYILIEKWLLKTEFNHENFVKFLEEKYKDLLPWIDFNSIKMVTFFQKRKLLMIINNFRDILKKEIPQ